MSLVSLQTDILDRRVQNDARIVFENHTYFAARDDRLSPKGQELAEMAESVGMSREKLISFRRWARRVTETSRERLAREMTLLYTLNEPRDRVHSIQYLTKGEAADIARVPGGDVLDLDNVYGGLMVRGRYVFVSDAACEDGLKKYEAPELLNGLIGERLSA